jgi:hypothetical protein
VTALDFSKIIKGSILVSNLIPYVTPPFEQFTKLTQNPGSDVR